MRHTLHCLSNMSDHSWSPWGLNTLQAICSSDIRNDNSCMRGGMDTMNKNLKGKHADARGIS